MTRAAAGTEDAGLGRRPAQGEHERVGAAAVAGAGVAERKAESLARAAAAVADAKAAGPALALADEVVLTDIYAAGESPIPGVTLEALAEAVRRHAPGLRVVPALDDVPKTVAAMVKSGDLVITLGAGSIASVPDAIVGLLERAEVPA